MNHQAMLFPAFNMQVSLQNKVCGSRFWDRQTGKRLKRSDGEYVSIAQLLVVVRLAHTFTTSVNFLHCGSYSTNVFGLFPEQAQPPAPHCHGPQPGGRLSGFSVAVQPEHRLAQEQEQVGVEHREPQPPQGPRRGPRSLPPQQRFSSCSFPWFAQSAHCAVPPGPDLLRSHALVIPVVHLAEAAPTAQSYLRHPHL